MNKLKRPVYWLISPEPDTRMEAWIAHQGGTIWLRRYGLWFTFPKLTPRESAQRVQQIVGPETALDVLVFARKAHLPAIKRPDLHVESIEFVINRSERISFEMYYRIVERQQETL